MAGIWVYAEMTGGVLDPSALELVSKARALPPDVAAVALGAGAGSATADLAAYGARTVFVDDDSVYDDYVAEPAAYALAELARAHRPELILFPPTFDSRDVAGRLQAMLGCTLMANADDLLAVDRARTRVALSVWPGRPGNLRGGVGGTKIVDVALSGPDPKLVIPRAKAFDAVPCGGETEIVPVEPSIPDELKRARRVKRHRDARPDRPWSRRELSWREDADCRIPPTSRCSTALPRPSATALSVRRAPSSMPAGCRSA